MCRYSIFLFAAFFVLLLSGSAMAGLLLTDGNAYNDGAGMDPGDGNPYWRGSVSFVGGAGASGWNIDATVEYAVYAPGMFGTSSALGMPDDPSGGTDWVYAYQVTNNSTLTLDVINALTVGLDVNESPNYIGFIDGADVNPSNAYFVPTSSAPKTSAKWDFQSPNIASGGTSSDIVYFTAPLGPEPDTASVQGAWAETRELPSPVPEPSTLCLMMLAVVALSWWRVARTTRD